MALDRERAAVAADRIRAISGFTGLAAEPDGIHLDVEAAEWFALVLETIRGLGDLLALPPR